MLQIPLELHNINRETTNAYIDMGEDVIFISTKDESDFIRNKYGDIIGHKATNINIKCMVTINPISKYLEDIGIVDRVDVLVRTGYDYFIQKYRSIFNNGNFKIKDFNKVFYRGIVRNEKYRVKDVNVIDNYRGIPINIAIGLIKK